MANTTRRIFLQRAAAAAAAAPLATPAVGSPGSANDRIGVACVGVGGMGARHVRWLAAQPDVRVAALVDVDRGHLDAAGAVAPDAARMADFREAIARPDVDAVLVATPDHWHGLIAVAAAEAGKHIYCEKPLTNSVGEGRAVADAVQRAGVVLQTGSHERSNPGAGFAKQLVTEGRLGRVREARVNLPNSDKHLQEVETFGDAPPDAEPPEQLDYDFWLGHTPESPYNERRCHFWWRFHSRYGGGEMTDRGAHVIDLAHYALGLDATGPVRVSASGTRPKGGFFDAFIYFDFEAHYADGLRLVGGNDGPRGVRLIGDDGELFIAVHGCELTASRPELLVGLRPAEENARDVHRREWIDAIRGEGTLVAPAEAGHRTASVCHLNNLAMRLGRPFDWDPVAERSSDPEVNALLTPTMRPPWTIE